MKIRLKDLRIPGPQLKGGFLFIDQLAAFVSTRFALPGMADGVVAAYREAIATKAQRPRLLRAPFALPSWRDAR